MQKQEKLTPLEQRFVDEYQVDMNASQAIVRAGYNTKYPDKLGSQVLGRARVKEAIQKAQRAAQKRTQVTQDRVIAELAKVAFDEVRDEETGLAYRDQHKMKALELLGKHLGMYTDKIDANVSGVMTVVFDKSMEDDDE